MGVKISKPFRTDVITGLLIVAGSIACAAYYYAFTGNTMLIAVSLVFALIGAAVTVFDVIITRYIKHPEHKAPYVPWKLVVNLLLLLGFIALQVAAAVFFYWLFILHPQSMPEFLLLAISFSIFASGTTLEFINKLMGWLAARRGNGGERGKESQKTPENNTPSHGEGRSGCRDEVISPTVPGYPPPT